MITDQDQKLSPMMVQWHCCKKSAPEGILLFRLGDFYEAFYEDAILLSKELDLTLTKRQEIPMAGIPFHTSEGYIDRLVAKGYSVAVAEQMEDPRSVKGLVKREVVRVITPGTLVNSTLLCDKSNNFLACIAQVGAIHGLCVLDLTTAEFKAMEFEEVKALADELYSLRPKEILAQEKWQKRNSSLFEEIKVQLGAAVHTKEDWHFEHSHTCDVLRRHFRVHHLEGFGLGGMISAVNAAGALLHYVKEDLNLTVDHIATIEKKQVSRYMLIDRSTQKNLELLEPLHDGKKAHSLLKVIDFTQTPMGGRLLKSWLTHPLLDLQEITLRQDGVSAFLDHRDTSKEIQRHLGEIRDLERLIMRIETGYASPRDLAGLRFSLEHIAPLSLLLKKFTAPAIALAEENFPDVSPIVETLRTALVDAPPLRLSDGGIFRAHFHPELDRLQALQKDSHSWVARYQVELREKTQIKTLKVGYTKAFGYYIEVSRGQAERIPPIFERRQTLVGAERFITCELKEFEHQILHAEERISALEEELFHALRKETAGYAPQIRKIAKAIAGIDCLLSLAESAKKYNYVRPQVDDGEQFHVVQGRHPIIEAFHAEEPYIPNDVHLNAQKERLYLITGPNMAGKSTFIRQVALIAILAQMGSFVPALEAHIGIVDKVFSRIGASDDLSRGQSTFMVEMTETANILNNATDRSLIILDEIGRGTSTYDGAAIAWSVAEYLRTEPGKQARTLFATHYRELTELEEKIEGVINYNVAIYESERGITFLRKIVRGSADKSYGIHVAKLAGLPAPVLKNAEILLQKLEMGTAGKPQKKPKEKQLSLFSMAGEDVIADLKKIDPNTLSPLEALKTLIAWKGKLS